MENEKYIITATVRGTGSYGSVLEGHLRSDPSIKLAFKFLRMGSSHGLLPHTQVRDIMALVALGRIMAERPDIGSGDVFIDFPINPLLDIIDGCDLRITETQPVPLEGVNASLVLVFPSCPCDLHTYLHSGNLASYTWGRFLHVCYLLVRCVAILHSVGWSHRDLKPSNILISGDGQLLLCDFGMARCEIPFFGRFGQEGRYNYATKRYLRNKMSEVGAEASSSFICRVPSLTQLELLNGNTAICGTVWWRAPEQCFGLTKHYSGFVSDAWSLGCSICDLIFDIPLFKTVHHDDFRATGEVLALINYLSPLVNCKKYHVGFVDTSRHQMRPELFSIYKQTIRGLNSNELIDQLCELRRKNQTMMLADREESASPQPPSQDRDREHITHARSLSLTVALDCARPNRARHLRRTLGALVPERTPAGINSCSSDIRLARLVLRNFALLSGKYWSNRIYYTTSKYNTRELLFFGLLLRFADPEGLATLARVGTPGAPQPLSHYKDLLILLNLREDIVWELRTLACLVEKMLNIDPDSRTLPTIVMNSPIFKAMAGKTGIDIQPQKENLRPVKLEKYRLLKNLRYFISFDMTHLSSNSIISLIERINIPILQNFVWDCCSAD